MEIRLICMTITIISPKKRVGATILYRFTLMREFRGRTPDRRLFSGRQVGINACLRAVTPYNQHQLGH